MLNIDSFSQGRDNDYYFSDYFDADKNGFFLLTNFHHKNLYKKKINKIILEKFLRDKPQYSPDYLTELKEFFISLNWKLFAELSKYDLESEGISLAFVEVYHEDIFIVTFGRFVSGIINDNQLLEIGTSWKNFRVKSYEELNLLGRYQKDIEVPIYQRTISKGERFVLCNSEITNESNALQAIIDDAIISKNILHISLKNLSKEQKENIYFFKKNRNILLGFIFLILAGFTVWYSFWGNNRFADEIEIRAEYNKDYSQNNLMDNLQNTIADMRDFVDKKSTKNNPLMMERFQQSLQTFTKILTTPARKIDLEVVQKVNFDEKIIAIPVFDLENVYTALESKLVILNKETFVPKMKLNFSEIKSMRLLDANLLLLQKQNELICINRKSYDTLWKKKVSDAELSHKNRSIYLSPTDDRRLTNSITLIMMNNVLKVINNLTGEELSNIKLKKGSYFLSSYDTIEKSIYLMSNNSFYKIRLDIKN